MVQGWETVWEGPREEVGIAAHRQRPNGEAQYTREGGHFKPL